MPKLIDSYIITYLPIFSYIEVLVGIRSKVERKLLFIDDYSSTIEPVALTYSIKVVQALDPGCLLRRFQASIEPSTRPLDPCPSRMPMSSILYRLAG